MGNEQVSQAGEGGKEGTHRGEGGEGGRGEGWKGKEERQERGRGVSTLPGPSPVVSLSVSVIVRYAVRVKTVLASVCCVSVKISVIGVVILKCGF